MNKNQYKPPRYEPSAAEIAEGTRQIRENWDEAEYQRRGRWMIPARVTVVETRSALRKIENVY